jgi:hypothetical protein
VEARDLDSAASPLRVFGALLRRYRVKAGMSLEQLGARVFLSDDMVGKASPDRLGAGWRAAVARSSHCRPQRCLPTASGALVSRSPPAWTRTPRSTPGVARPISAPWPAITLTAAS